MLRVSRSSLRVSAVRAKILARALCQWYANGAIARFCSKLPFAVVSTPARRTDEEAATVPIGALTA
jgi:hypothetical protein